MLFKNFFVQKDLFWYNFSGALSLQTRLYISRLWVDISNFFFRTSTGYCFLTDLYNNQDVVGTLPWRLRFRIQGMGFFYKLLLGRLKVSGRNVYNLLIKTGHSHFEWFIVSSCSFLVYISGYKNRILVLRADLYRSVHELARKIALVYPPAVYRRKGIAFSRTRFFFKRGKKKFV